MARTQRYTQQQVIDALTESRGLVTFAAQRLGCDPDTVTNYAHRYPRVRAARDAARTRQLDAAEGRLFEAINDGESWAIQFFLRTIGRRRGYGDHLELDGQVDVLHAPEWIRTRAVLVEVLRAYPDAQTAVVTRLRAIEGGAGRDDDYAAGTPDPELPGDAG